MKKLKIVIISANCYPALGPRAHRTTELAKELTKRGNDVTVYALLGNFDYSNYSIETGIKFRNLGVSKLGITDNENSYNTSFYAKMLRKIFAKSLHLPYLELMFLTKKALKIETNIDYLITIAQPHPIHWGAANYVAKNKNKVKFWVADCGDPFMKDPFNWHPPYFSYFEKKWGKLCNYITIPIEEAKSAYYPEFVKKIKVIPQGFDFEQVRIANYVKNKIPTFAYSGAVYTDKRDPSQFLNYLYTLDCDFRFIVYTGNDLFFKPYKDKLRDKLEIRKYVPRLDLLYELSKVDFLINIKNESGVQQPSKLIDYATTKRPILNISTKFSESMVFNNFIKGNFEKQLKIDDLNRYNIKNVANRFIELSYI